MAGEKTLKVWYDFNCPFARIGSHWLRNVEKEIDYAVEWKSFSLEQINLPPEADRDALWATPEERRGLLPAAAAKWAQSQGADVFRTVQRTVFDARHVERKPIGKPDDLGEILTAAGVDGPTVVKEILADRTWLDAARADHQEAESLGVFGVPTFHFPDVNPMFVRITKINEGERALELFRKIEAVATDPELNELKRPQGFRR